jgi:hypothetical protein
MPREDPTPPESGHYRIACNEPCEVQFANLHTVGVIWNVSTVGVYILMNGPLPDPGNVLKLSFTLPGDSEKITCYARVAWQNPASIFKGCGTVAPPPAAPDPGAGGRRAASAEASWPRSPRRALKNSGREAGNALP